MILCSADNEFAHVCFGFFQKAISANSLPHWCPVPHPPFSFYEGPRAKAGGPEAQYYHQLFFSPTIVNAAEIKIVFFWIRDWMLVCATSYNGSRLSDVLCSKYLGWISCPPPRWISRITPQHWTTFWKIQNLPTNVICGGLPGNKTSVIALLHYSSVCNLYVLKI